MRYAFIICCLVMASCDQTRGGSSAREATSTGAAKRITIVPLGADLPPDFAQRAYAEIAKGIPAVDVAALQPFPASTYNPSRHRFRADSLIVWLHGSALPGQTLLGITNADISTTKDGVEDWGVMGL